MKTLRTMFQAVSLVTAASLATATSPLLAQPTNASAETRAVFPFAGQIYEVNYGGRVIITYTFASDRNSFAYEITRGPHAGGKAEVEFQWHELEGGNFVISWQEPDGSTSVHVDNFDKGTSLTFFTTPTSEFNRFAGTIRRIEAARR